MIRIFCLFIYFDKQKYIETIKQLIEALIVWCKRDEAFAMPAKGQPPWTTGQNLRARLALILSVW